MKRIPGAIVSLSFAGFLGLAARAAPPPDSAAKPVVAYDEEALVRYALAHNPDLRAARGEQDVSRAKVTTVSALSNPVARGEWLHVQSLQNAGWGIGLEWTPPRPGSFGARKDAAIAEARATKHDFAEIAADLEARVRIGCAVVDALREEIALAETSVATRRAIAQAVKTRLERGASSKIDMSLVTVSNARGEQERDLLVLAKESASADLAALAGLPPIGTLELTPRRTGDTAGERRTPDNELVQRAITSRPIVQADSARAEAATRTVSAERAQRWPWIDLQARYRRNDQSNYPDDVTLGLEVTLPILDRNGGPIAEAEATHRVRTDLAAAHRFQIERDVRVLRAESERRAQIARHYEESIAPVLKEHAALVKQALAGMELDLTSVLNAEDMVTRGAIDYVEVRLAQHKAEIALARALGTYGRARPSGAQ
jgi:outer membrane protein TolC